MADVEHSFEVGAEPEEILHFLLDDRFVGQLKGRLDRVSEIEVDDLEQLEDGRIRRVGRFSAPTELPRALRRWEKKAPDFVHWEEIWHVDPGTHHIETEIVADAPEHWHDYYDNRGEIRIDAIGDGRSRIRHTITFSLDAPMGLGMFLKRAVKGVIGDVFDAHAEVLKEQFGR